MGDLDNEANWDRDVLKRIVALLFALAGLADLAADLPLLHRRQMLEILGWGEAEARAFLTGVDAPADAPDMADAARLAARLRALALLLIALLARPFALASAACSRARLPSHGISMSPVCRPDVTAPAAPDTS